MSKADQALTVSEEIATVIAQLSRTTPPATMAVCNSLLIDVTGICISARNSDFMQSTLAATDEPGGTRQPIPSSTLLFMGVGVRARLTGGARRGPVRAQPHEGAPTGRDPEARGARHGGGAEASTAASAQGGDQAARASQGEASAQAAP